MQSIIFTFSFYTDFFKPINKSGLLALVMQVVVSILLNFSSLSEPESVAPYPVLPNFPAEKHVHGLGENFGLKICSNNVFGLSEVAGCPEETTTFRFYYCSMSEIAGAAKVFDFFYYHFFISFRPSRRSQSSLHLPFGMRGGTGIWITKALASEYILIP